MKVSKKLLLVTALILFAGSSFGQGIVFFKGTFDQTLALAKKEGKQIFVDVYTTWCAPCKKMSMLTFTDPAVGEFFNKNFISFKVDAENESDHGFFKKYSAGAFPSLFWLTADGDLLDKQEGYKDPAGLIQAAKTAVTKNLEASNRALEERWKSGERSYDLFIKYVFGTLNTFAPEKIRPLTQEFLATLSKEQLRTEETYKIVRAFMRSPADDLIFKTLLDNWDFYVALESDKDGAWINMYRCLVRSTSAYLLQKDIEGYKAAITRMEGLDFRHKELYIESVGLEKLIFDHKYSEALDMILALGDKYGNAHPYIYGQYIYTLIIGEYFLQKEVLDSDADKLISIARMNSKYRATQESMVYLAASYARKGDYKKAYEYLASLGFYPKPMLSNAVYPKLRLPVPKNEFPW
ncbi:MAG: thioredoxin family protein [Bacteroidales bacterium]|nr:thioredoxin family protein [Bacteroidales bacterium]